MSDDGVEARVQGFLHKKFPGIDEDLLNYVVDVTKTSAEDFEDAEEIYDAVGGVLHEATENDDEDEIKEICNGIMNLIKGGEEEKPQQQVNGKRILDAPIHIGDRAKKDDEHQVEQNSIWMKQNVEDTTLKTVDLKKLERAEAKQKQKLERRDKDDKDDESSAGPTTNQVIQKKDMKQELLGGKVVDIRIENFDLAYGSKVLLQNCNLVMAFGRRYGFVGRNGMGKTTLLRAISKRELYIPSHVTVLHVEQEVVGDETLATDSVLEADTVRFNLLKEEEELSALVNEGKSTDTTTARLSEIYAKLADIEADKAPARAAMILDGLGFTPEMQKMKTKEFSGGWRMRLALARALSTKPDLLLLDEPTNMLDVKAILWLENYLQTWPTTIFVVSHDRMFLDAVSTDIIFLHSKMLDCYKGNYTQFVITKDEKLKNQQREYEAQKQYRDHLQAYVDRWRVNANRAAQAQSKLKILEKLPDLKPVEIEPEVVLRLPETDRVNATMLRLDEFSFSYDGKKNIFEKTDLNANMDARIAVIGENGSGKTTLLKILLGELEVTGGVRHVHRAMRVGYFSQHHVDALSLKQTSLEFFKKRFPGKLDVEYRSHLGKYGVTGDLAMRPISSLSGGQKSRVAFALMTWHEPNFFILDEPTNHLDIETVEALGKALQKFNGGVILVSHNEQLIQMIAQETWLCGEKTVKRIDGGFQAYKKTLEEEFKRINAI
ncbi:ATP-binding cassette sub-family F member 3-like [Clytia hemisphaerica]|uniref:ABC transporter domain-containing protein n=1 Tax=Clytia hemisphaerica TaxID=252671 RepID=A0A7M5WTR7_9CNID